MPYVFIGLVPYNDMLLTAYYWILVCSMKTYIHVLL